MFTIENLLASKFIAKRELKKVKDVEVVVNPEDNNIFLTFNFLVGKKKDGSDHWKLYKNNITKIVMEHGGLENLYKALVAAEMMIQGYIIIPIEGGWLCVGGTEVYSMKEQECTCQAYTIDPSKPCKHLTYKEALLLQRSRINQWKRENL